MTTAFILSPPSPPAAGGVPVKSGLKTRPWLLSPGPTTRDGKLAIRINNLKHRYHARMPMPEATANKAFGR